MEKLAPVLTASDFELEFREPLSLPNPMLVLRDVDCGYGRNAIVRDVDRTVLAGQRIGILGANGQGKSTLVKTIARVLPPLAGTVTEGKGLAIGYFAQQELDLLREDDTALQQMVRQAPEAREQELRDFLGRFRFSGEMVHQPIGTLSGGEQARLVLASIVWQRPNLLLLDEPTNHLDLDTREALSVALNEFDGTLLLVSHDRALLREVCDEFWLVAGGAVQPFDGDLDDYQRWLIENARAAARARDDTREHARRRRGGQPRRRQPPRPAQGAGGGAAESRRRDAPSKSRAAARGPAAGRCSRRARGHAGRTGACRPEHPGPRRPRPAAEGARRRGAALETRWLELSAGAGADVAAPERVLRDFSACNFNCAQYNCSLCTRSPRPPQTNG